MVHPRRGTTEVLFGLDVYQRSSPRCSPIFSSRAGRVTNPARQLRDSAVLLAELCPGQHLPHVRLIYES